MSFHGRQCTKDCSGHMEITKEELRLRDESQFQEGLRVGKRSTEKMLLDMANTKQAYMDENEQLTNLLLAAEDRIQELEDRIQELEAALLMPFGI